MYTYSEAYALKNKKETKKERKYPVLSKSTV
jgi:hypothetical protein